MERTREGCGTSFRLPFDLVGAMGTGIMEGSYSAIFAAHHDYGNACDSNVLDEEISR
jgi:hypothetical protein